MPIEKPLELGLEIGQGNFRLSLDGLILNVHVRMPQGVEMPVQSIPIEPQPLESQAAPAPAVVSAPEAPATERLSEELDYYRQASHEIYAGLGKLAKEINLSIQDLSLAEIIQTGMASPGERLDQARNQVADVLQMTEKATLNILDLVEQIREDCEAVQEHLQYLAQPQEASGKDAAPDPQDSEASPAWSQLLAQGAELAHQVKVLRQAAPGPQPETAIPQLAIHFPLAEVIQIVLEFCGNETVKQHLRAIQAQQEAVFDVPVVEQAMSRLAAQTPEEDGFYQFPVAQVLELLKDYCNDERVKGLLNKMLASAGKIFPMDLLPLEGHPQEAEAALLETPLFTPSSEVLPQWEEFWQQLLQVAAQADAGVATNLPRPDYRADAQTQDSLMKVDRIIGSLSRITEALAFQDLSGQRLLKVMNLLRQLQVQVLTLLVAAGTKLKIKMDQQELSLKEHEILAQEELDRLLHTLATPVAPELGDPEGLGKISSTDDQPLDQDSVNDLLNSMGF